MPARPALFAWSLVAIGSGLVAQIARAELGAGQQGVESVFFVAKSENRNQVHYGISVDGSCAPRGEAPVFAYWRMLERGPLASEPLLAREVPAYGFADQRVLVRDERGGRVRVTLNAMPKRPIVFETARRGDTCVATARATIGGTPAWLKSVFLQLRWPWGIAYMDLSGQDSESGKPVRERVAN